MTTSTCPRHLPQHFNGCTCAVAPGAQTAEVDADLVAAFEELATMVEDYNTHGFVHLPGLGDISRGERGGPHTPVADMAEIAATGTDAERGLLASNVHAPAEVLSTLAEDRHPGVRAALAANEYAPAAALVTVATRDPGPTTMEIRALVSNANTPYDALEAIALPYDENEWHYPLSATDLANHRNATETLLVAIRDGFQVDHQARGNAISRLSNKRYDEMYEVTREVNDGELLGWDEDDEAMKAWDTRADQIAALDPAGRPTAKARREEIAAIVRGIIARRTS